MKFRILSIDGGGLRGFLPLQVLKHIERLTQAPISDSFDLIAGTSTGGLLAAALTLPSLEDPTKPRYTAASMDKLYLEDGKKIFPPAKSKSSKVWRDIRNIFRPRFPDKGRNEVFDAFFGEKRLTDSLKPILLTAYNLRENDSAFFSTRKAHAYDNLDFYLKDICKATSAAPTYLPSHEILCTKFGKPGEIPKDKAWAMMYKGGEKLSESEWEGDMELLFQTPFIDGGIFMNNPTLGAVAELLKHKDEPIYGANPTLTTDDIYVLSLGTGYYERDLSVKKVHQWGQIQWIAPLIDMMMNGVSQSVHYQANQLLKDENYLRIDFELGKEGDAGKSKIAKKYQRQRESWLDMSNSKDEVFEFLSLVGKGAAHNYFSDLCDFLTQSGIEIKKQYNIHYDSE